MIDQVAIRRICLFELRQKRRPVWRRGPYNETIPLRVGIGYIVDINAQKMVEGMLIDEVDIPPS